MRSRHFCSRVVAGLAAVGIALVGAVGLTTVAATAQAAEPVPGIHVSGGRIVEADGTELLLRGINHPHAWYPSQTGSFAGIKSTGANVVRVVLSSGDQWARTSAAEVANLVSLCTASKLICMFEVHDTTGYGDTQYAPNAVTLDKAVDYWAALYPTLAGTEDRVMINIGNEPFGNDATLNAQWGARTSAAVQRLRQIGFRHALVADAPNWGQDWQGIMKDQADEVFAADPQRNTVFSVHMYGVYGQASTVTAYLQHFAGAGLPLIVGEFGGYHSDGDVDEDAIMSEARRLRVGYLGWSWSGNGGGVEYLDIVQSFDRTRPTAWGTRLVDGADGLRQTSVEARVFGGSTPTPTTTPTSRPTPTPTPTPVGACTATLRITQTWGGGFTGEVTVKAGAAALSSWTTRWTLPSGTGVSSVWNGELTVSGGTATVRNASWNGSVPASGTTSFGFQGSGTAPSSVPQVSCAAG